MNAALVRQAAEDIGVNPDRMILAPRFQFRDPGIAHIAWALKAELEASAFPIASMSTVSALALATRLVSLQTDDARRGHGR